MSQSRLEKVGTFYSRMRALLESGARKADFRPIWMDVYERHPPKLEPRWDREPEKAGPLPRITYPEDAVRAQFYRQFGESSHAHDLADKEGRSLAQSFVDRFEEVRKEREEDSSWEEMFVITAEAMERDGVSLQGRDHQRSARKFGKVESPRDEGDEAQRPKIAPVSFKELFAKGGEKEKDS